MLLPPERLCTMRNDTLATNGSGKLSWSKNEERLHVVLFSLFYPAVLGTFFFTLFPEILRVVTNPLDLSPWDYGKTGIAVLLVFHFVFDFVFTSEISKYNLQIFVVDFLVLVVFFMAYNSVQLGNELGMDIRTTSGAMGVTYLLFRLWAHRVGGAVRGDRALRIYELSSATWFFAVMILAMFSELYLVAFWLLTIGLLASAILMWTIAPKTLREFERGENR